MAHGPEPTQTAGFREVSGGSEPMTAQNPCREPGPGPCLSAGFSLLQHCTALLQEILATLAVTFSSTGEHVINIFLNKTSDCPFNYFYSAS